MYKKDDNYPSKSTNEVFYNTYLPALVSKINTFLLTNRMLIIEKNKHFQEMENNMNMLNHNILESNSEEIDDVILEDQNVNITPHAQVTSARYEAQGQG